MRRSALALVIIAVLAAIPTKAGADPSNLTLTGSPEPASPRVGDVVTFVWTASDPDPFTVVDAFSVVHRPDSMTTIMHGRRLAPCFEPVESPAGLDRELRTYASFSTPGTYEVVATVDATQRLCDQRLSAQQRATATMVIEVTR